MSIRTPRSDAGFTLPEMMIGVVMTGIIATTIAFVITVSLKALPSATDRTDSSVAVQGITTWLPPDVDSTEPGAFDTTAGRASGCTGVDPGQNLLHLSWSETFAGTTTRFVANYRFIVTGTTGRIVRVSCKGVFALGAPLQLEMSAKLSTTVPTVTKSDADGDGLVDQANFKITTLSGEIVYIDAATKNPHETLPPVVTSPTVPTTTTTLPPNLPPTASNMSVTVNPLAPIVFTVLASDPNGDVLTLKLGSLPSGWSATISGLQVTLTPTGPVGTYTINYEVKDPSGAEVHANITVNVVSTPTTTSTTTTTTTTTLPPCVVSSMTLSPSTVALKFTDPSKLRDDVTVGITLGGGYCVGLTLQYVTGAPNGQYIQNFGSSAPYTVTLEGHPKGTELWSVGPHVLEVRDGGDKLLAQRTLTVTP